MKHWLRKPLQFFFLLVGLSLATALWSSIQLLNSQAKNSYESAIKILATNEPEIILPKKNRLIAIESFAMLRKAGWPVTPVLEGNLSQQSSLTIIGLDPFTMSEANGPLDELFKDTENLEKFVLKKNLAFASKTTAKKVENLSLKVDISVSEKLLPNVLITDIAVAEKILKIKGKATRFELTAPSPNNKEILEELGLRLVTSQSKGDLEQLTKSFHLNLSAFGFLGFVVGLFIVYSTLNLAFEQRKVTYKTLRSIGVPVRIIYASALSEIIILALIGGMIGICLGHWLASILFPDVASTLNDIYGANVGGKLILSVEEFFLALLMPLLGTLLISTSFVIKLIQIAPNKLNSLLLWNKLSENESTIKLYIALILIGLTTLLAKSPLGLLQSFVIIGLVILTGSILLPLMLRAILFALIHLTKKTPLGNWFLADSSLQANRIALSLNALMLAVAVTIGVDNMVKSFKETFEIWLEKRLITELYIRAEDEKMASRLTLELEDENLIKNVFPISDLKTRFKDKPIAIIGFEPAEIYVKNWPLVSFNSETWENVQNGKGVLVNEQFYYEHDLGIGSTIKLDSTLNTDKQVTHQIVGIYSDYGNRLGQIMMNISSFEKHYSEEIPLDFAVEINSDSFAPVSRMLMEKYGVLKSDIINQLTIKQFSTKVFDRTFSITSALSDAMIIIATLTIFTSLITLSEIRITNLSPLWVLGITRLTLLKFELTQLIMLAILTLSFAIPLGLLICYFLTSFVNVAAFGWKLPFEYYPTIWLKTLLIALLASIGSILIPSILLFKNSPGLMIRRYKNDV